MIPLIQTLNIKFPNYEITASLYYQCIYYCFYNVPNKGTRGIIENCTFDAGNNYT